MLCASEGLTFGLRPNALGLRTSPHCIPGFGNVNRETLGFGRDVQNQRPFCYARTTGMNQLSSQALAKETFSAILRDIAQRDDGELREERLREAFAFAAEKYGDKMHWTGKSLLEHALGTLKVFLAFDPDEDAVIACILQHALETNTCTVDTLKETFGEDVKVIVSSVHLLSHVTVKNRRMSMEHLRMMFLRISDDPRVVLLVLCRQRFLIDHLTSLPQDECMRACRDILHLFAPVAARLGIYSLKHQLERAAFPVVYSSDSQRIAEQMNDIHTRYGDFLQSAATSLTRYLHQEGVSALVDVREKQHYSIFRKMQEKSVTHVEELYDLFAVRVIVQTDLECYQVLGLLHRIGHPIQNRFKDYIAFPKPNGYQSLHTTLAHMPGAPDWVFIEVQVRTEAMHREAEFGIAAHWRYKEGGKALIAAKRAQVHKMLDETQPENAVGLMLDHIFVLTPRGDVVELPEGATPLDFAFQLHTDLGIAFRAAKVNGAIVPLTHVLENGDIVEVLKHRDPHPSPRWMTQLKMASARSRLKKYLISRERPAYLAKGKEMLNDELQRRGLDVLDADLSILRTFDDKVLSLEEREDLLLSIALGGQRVSSVLQHLPVVVPPLPTRPAKRPRATKALRVVTEDGLAMPLLYAKCCKPLLTPGVPITGIISRDGDVRVHKIDCKLIRKANKERVMKVKWE